MGTDVKIRSHPISIHFLIPFHIFSQRNTLPVSPSDVASRLKESRLGMFSKYPYGILIMAL